MVILKVVMMSVKYLDAMERTYHRVYRRIWETRGRLHSLEDATHTIHTVYF